MDETTLLRRVKSFIDDYGDMFLLHEDEHKLVVKDGEGNFFEVNITKM
jgi:hypothetical protein